MCAVRHEPEGYRESGFHSCVDAWIVVWVAACCAESVTVRVAAWVSVSYSMCAVRHNLANLVAAVGVNFTPALTTQALNTQAGILACVAACIQIAACVQVTAWCAVSIFARFCTVTNAAIREGDFIQMTHMHTCTCMCKRTCTRKHTRAHARTHTHIHTHTHKLTY